MATDYEMRFGAKSNSNRGSSRAQSDEKAELWINIGYVAKGAGENGEDIFVSLPLGLPLDTQKPLKTNSSNEAFAALQAARNDLWEQIMDMARALKPGEEKILNTDAPLQIQIRRVREEQEVSVDATKNKFARKLAFA